MSRRVVITGMEVITAIGTGLKNFWNAALSGTSGIRRIKAYDPSAYPTQIAGEVTDFSLDEYPEYNKTNRYPRVSQFALYCSHKAIKDAGIHAKSDDLSQAGVFIGSGQGGIPELGEGYQAFFTNNWKKIPVLTVLRGMHNSSANHIAIELGAGGPNVTIANACNSSAEAITRAYEQIHYGKLSLALAGGTETPVFEPVMAAWCKLRVMSTANAVPGKASRPFDKTRDGMVMAEGAGILVLEELEHAKARGAHIYAEILGFGSSCDAHHITAPCVEGQSRAIRQALKEANLSPESINYISAHGTSTSLNDSVETETIKNIFGDKAYNIPISSLKSMTGHTIGAAGAIEIAATALSLQDGKMHPTINLENPDPECDLDYIPTKARHAPIEHALSNHFAFGGANTAIILRRYS